MNAYASKQPRLYALDGLRGLCAVAVMLYHILSWNKIEWFQIGTFGVYLFYVLSGFSLWYAYAARPMDIPLLRRFFVARFARIFPLYFLAGLLVLAERALFLAPEQAFSPEFLMRFLFNVTLLFGFVMPGDVSYIAGGWSIGIEWVFYLCFPVCLLFLRRISTLCLALLAAMCINQVYAGFLFASGGTLGDRWVLYTHFPTFLVYFIAGILAAEIYLRLPRRSWPWGARITPLAALALIFCYPAASTESYLVGAHFALLVGAAMLAIFCAGLLDAPYPAERLLYSFLGNISYGVYLLHFLVYENMKRLLAHVRPEYGLDTLLALSATATLALAYAVYRFYEAPARDRINRRFGG